MVELAILIVHREKSKGQLTWFGTFIRDVKNNIEQLKTCKENAWFGSIRVLHKSEACWTEFEELLKIFWNATKW